MYTNCNQSIYIFLIVWYNKNIGEKKMAANITIKKIWEDDFSAEFNIKFQSKINFESFSVSGNFYLSEGKTFEQLSKALINGAGDVVFEGVGGDCCKLKISENSRGLKNINYHLFIKEQNYETEDSLDVSINTGYIIEPAIVDRIASRLKEFYNEPEGCEISLVYTEE